MSDRLRSSGDTAAFKLSPRHIHIYKGDVRQGVVNCEEQISAYCVDNPQTNEGVQTNQGSLWAAGESGRIYHVDLNNLQLLPSRIDDDKDNQDIFNTLLASQAPGSAVCSTDQRQETDTLKLKLKDCKVNLGVYISSLCARKDLLCICSSIQMSGGVNYTISVYHIKDLILLNNSSFSSGFAAAWTKQLYLKVPLSKLDNTDNLFLLSKNLFQAEDDNEATLSTVFFDHLFSSGSALLDTCVVLFASQSGILFYYKLKELGQTSQIDSNILCTLGQPIIAIHTFIATLVANENLSHITAPFPSQSGSQYESEFVCMAVIGRNGKTMLFYQSKKVFHHQIIILPGSIIACHCAKNNIYFSTNEMLYRGRLSVRLSEEKHLKFELSVKRLGYSGITGLSSVPGCTIDGHILFCFSRKGRLYTVEDDGQNGDKMAAAGTQMKNLVQSIGKTDEEVTRFKNVISKQNDILSQLSIASKLAALSASGSKTNDKASKLKQLAKILKVQVTSKIIGVGSRKEFSVQVRLTNVSVAEFNSDWIFMVHLQHFQDFKQERVLSSSSKSLPLINGLRPEAVEEIEIPLEGTKLRLPLLTVSTYLVYNTQTIRTDKFGSKSERKPFGSKPDDFDNPALCILINEKRLDVLDFLEMPTGPIDKSTISTDEVLSRSDLCTHSDVVEFQAKKRPQYKLYTSNHEGMKETSVENHSLVIHLDGRKHSILRECVTSTDVLRQVLSLTNIVADEQITSAVIRVCTFGGCHLTLSVASSQSESSFPSSNVIGYQLTIQGEDLPVVVLMRSAFLERLSETVQTATVTRDEDTVTEVHVRNLLKTIKVIERRREEGDRIQDGRLNKTQSMQSSCISVYKQLRNVSFIPEYS